MIALAMAAKIGTRPTIAPMIETVLWPRLPCRCDQTIR
jgi:hypothetical protein